MSEYYVKVSKKQYLVHLDIFAASIEVKSISDVTKMHQQ